MDTQKSPEKRLILGPKKYGRYEDTKTEEERLHHLRLVGERLKERYSHIPFYAQRAKKVEERDGSDEAYWTGLAASEVNAL